MTDQDYKHEIAVLQAEIRKLQEKNDDLEGEVIMLEKENERLTTGNELLTQEVNRLEDYTDDLEQMVYEGVTSERQL